jgi:hypothetical protein
MFSDVRITKVETEFVNFIGTNEHTTLGLWRLPGKWNELCITYSGQSRFTRVSYFVDFLTYFAETNSSD